MTAITLEAIEPQSRRALRWWHLILPLAVLFLAPVVGGFAIGIVLGFVGGLHHDAVYAPLLITRWLHDPFVLQMLMAFSYVLMLGVLWWTARSRGPFPLAGYFAKIDARTALFAAICGLALVGVFTGIANILESSHVVTFHETKAEELFKAHSVGQLCFSLLIGALLGPLAEEIYFRGLFFVWLRQNWSLTVAAAVNVLLFAFMHGDMFLDPGIQGWIETAGIACVALVNVMLTVRTGSLWPAFIAHGVFNGVQLLTSSVPTLWGHGW